MGLRPLNALLTALKSIASNTLGISPDFKIPDDALTRMPMSQKLSLAFNCFLIGNGGGPPLASLLTVDNPSAEN